MTGKASLLIIVLILCAITISGCKKEEDRPVVNPVKTSEINNERVVNEIDETNLDSELDKLEKEIQADIDADNE